MLPCKTEAQILAPLLEELAGALGGALVQPPGCPESMAVNLTSQGRALKISLWLCCTDLARLSISVRSGLERAAEQSALDLSIRAPLEQDWGWVNHWLRLVPTGLELHSRGDSGDLTQADAEAIRDRLPDQLHALMTDPPAPLFESFKFYPGCFVFWPHSVKTQVLTERALIAIERAVRIVEAFEAKATESSEPPSPSTEQCGSRC